MQRYYNVDLADLWRGKIGVRKLAVLASCLPPDSATMRAEGGNSSLTAVEHLLRGLNHRLDLLMYQNGGAKGKKPAPPKAPETHREIRAKNERLAAKKARYLEKYGNRA